MLSFAYFKSTDVMIVQLPDSTIVRSSLEDVGAAKWLSLAVGSNPHVVWVVHIGTTTHTGTFHGDSRTVIGVAAQLTALCNCVAFLRNENPVSFWVKKSDEFNRETQAAVEETA